MSNPLLKHKSSDILTLLNVKDNSKIILPKGLYLSKLCFENGTGMGDIFLLNLVRTFLNKNYLSYGDLIYQNSSQTLYKLLGKQFQYCIHNGSKLIGFIGRTHIPIQIFQRTYKGVEMGYLSIDSKFRNKHLGHTLIRAAVKEEMKVNEIGLYLANPKLISKYASDVLCSFEIHMRYFNAKKYRRLGFLKNQILYENIVDLQNIQFPYQIRVLKREEIQKYYNDYMKYLKKTYDVFYNYDYELFQDFFCK